MQSEMWLKIVPTEEEKKDLANAIDLIGNVKKEMNKSGVECSHENEMFSEVLDILKKIYLGEVIM